MAMQSLMRTKGIEDLNEDGCIDFLANLAVGYGRALCVELGKVKLDDLVKEIYANTTGK